MTVSPRRPLVVVMGVSGCGKTSVGTAVATHLDVPFVDADDLHPPANIAKMASGTPLDDADREPWLVLVGQALADADTSGRGLVVACSALAARYRDTVRGLAPGVLFAHLVADRDTLRRRLRRRRGHFMPADLLDSQLATLEGLAARERGITLDATLPVSQLSATIAVHARPRFT